MSSPAIFPNGASFTSSALTPPAIETIFQTLILQIFNITIDPKNPDAAYRQVRCGWQQRGQPAWNAVYDAQGNLTGENVCIVTAYPQKDQFSSWRDELLATNDDQTDAQNMARTQVWRMHFTLYGPTSWNNALLILSSMALDWVRFALAATWAPPIQAPGVSQLYILGEFPPPIWAPEEFQSQWWPRVDLDLKFNEQINESTLVETALSDQVTLTTDTGFTETITIE